MDIDKLVEAVTKEIMKRLDSAKCCSKVLLVGEVCDSVLGPDTEATKTESCDSAAGFDYVVMSAEKYDELLSCKGSGPSGPQSECQASCSCSGSQIDLSKLHLIHERHLREKNAKAGDEVLVCKKAIVTALANDYAKSKGAKITRI